MGEFWDNEPDWDDVDDPYGPPESDDPEWVCGDGETLIPLSEIEDGHLLNIERWLLGRGAKDAGMREKLFEWWHPTILAEIERRGLQLLNRPHLKALERMAQSGMARG